MVRLATVVGAPFEVELASASGGGYLWELQPAPPGVRLLDAGMVTRAGPATAAAPGDASAQTFRLQAEQRGALQLRFVLKRRWESEPIETRTIDVDVG